MTQEARDKAIRQSGVSSYLIEDVTERDGCAVVRYRVYVGEDGEPMEMSLTLPAGGTPCPPCN